MKGMILITIRLLDLYAMYSGPNEALQRGGMNSCGDEYDRLMEFEKSPGGVIAGGHPRLERLSFRRTTGSSADFLPPGPASLPFERNHTDPMHRRHMDYFTSS